MKGSFLWFLEEKNLGDRFMRSDFLQLLNRAVSFPLDLGLRGLSCPVNKKSSVHRD